MLISVIIPVYNSEKYLEKCLNSILNQTYSNYEIILIDDGSIDESKRICREICENHSNISFFSDTNKGSANARNIGLEKAKGDYVSFVDSDDWVDEHMYEKLVDALKTNRVDIVSCDFCNFKVDGRITSIDIKCREGLFDKYQIAKEIFPNLIISSNLEQESWPIQIVTKLYRRDFLLLNKIKFEKDLRTGQDIVFSIASIVKATSFYYLKNDYLYYYRDNLDSRTHTYLEKSWENYNSINRNISLLVENNAKYNFSKQIELMKLQGVLSSIAYVFKSGNTNNFISKYKYIRKFASNVNLTKALSTLDWKRTSKRKFIYCLLLKYKMYLIISLLTNGYFKSLDWIYGMSETRRGVL